MLIQLLANGLANASVIALMAVGFALIYNTTRIFHVAHGAIYVFAGYVYYFAVETLMLNWLAALAVTLLATAAVGTALESLTYTPLYRKQASTTVCLLTSFGLYVAIVNSIALAFGNEVHVTRPIGGATIALGPILLTRVQLVEMVVAITVLTPVTILLRHSTWGRLIRAVRDNPRLATALGIDLSTVRRLVLVLGSVLAAIAAILAVIDTGIDPQTGMPVLLIAAVAVIVGSIGSFGGSILGSVVVAILQSLAVWQISPKWSEAITFAILIAFLIFRPTGLLGNRKRLEEVAE